MPIIDFQWPVLTEYDLTQANKRPVEATPIELGYEIDRLKKDAAFHKQTLIDYQNRTQTYMDDYKNVEADYRNLLTEHRRLVDVDDMNVLLMKQNLELREQLGK